MRTINTIFQQKPYILYIVGAALLGGIPMLTVDGNTSGLTYSKNVDVNFTVQPSVSIELSSSNLVIDELSPGAASDSNIINLTLETNSSAGYYLYSTVGNSTYDTTNLVQSGSDSTFESLASAGSLTAGKWGYSYATTCTATPCSASTTDWTGWSNYDGLIKYDSETTPTNLVEESSNSSRTIGFKIGAYADDTQASGEYNNVVNFIAVVNPEPTAVYMQDLTSSTIAALLPNVGSTTTAVDKRDNKEYTIAKLADNKYWMTTNLNLAGGTTLNASDSNVPSDNYYTLPDSTAITSGTSVPSDQFSNDSTAYVFNTGNNTTTCNSSTPCNSYYSWLAATAGGKDSSGTAVTANGYNAAYSICPKGWRLPTSTTSNASAQTSPNWKTGDWYALMTAYGANLESNYNNNSDSNFYNNAGPGTTPNFLLAGLYLSGSFYYGGSSGSYWSATSYSSSRGYGGIFSSSGVHSANFDNRRSGLSVRCLFAE